MVKLVWKSAAGIKLRASPPTPLTHRSPEMKVGRYCCTILNSKTFFFWLSERIFEGKIDVNRNLKKINESSFDMN